MEEASMSGSMRQGEADRSPQLLEKKCRLYRALSNEEVSESLKVAFVHKTLQHAGLWKHLLRSAATLDSFPSIKDEVVNYGFAEAAARRTAPTDDDQVNLVECKGKMGRERVTAQARRAKAKEKNERANCEGDERRCFYCDGKGHIKSNCPQKEGHRRQEEERLHELIVEGQRHAWDYGRDSSRERVE